MAFHDVKLPDNISQGYKPEPVFDVDIISYGSFSEQRTLRRTYPRLRFEIAYPVQKDEDAKTVYDFYMSRHGQTYSFRFKDWFDYKGQNEPLGTGDATRTEFQLVRAYQDAGGILKRPITKPVSGTVEVYVNGTLETNLTIDHLTGIITFNSPPAAGTTVSADFEFDVPVRFEDRIRPVVKLQSLASIERLNLLEVDE